jgi:hypothetical protein
VDTELAAILDEARAQIARGEEPDGDALAARIAAHPRHDRALAQLSRLLAVARAKRAVGRPAPAAPSAPKPRVVYRARPTIAANTPVRARGEGAAVVLEWDAARGVAAWDVRIAERADARSPYAETGTLSVGEPQVELDLGDLPKRISIVGRNASGRIVQRAVISGLTVANWRQKWQQRASAG